MLEQLCTMHHTIDVTLQGLQHQLSTVGIPLQVSGKNALSVTFKSVWDNENNLRSDTNCGIKRQSKKKACGTGVIERRSMFTLNLLCYKWSNVILSYVIGARLWPVSSKAIAIPRACSAAAALLYNLDWYAKIAGTAEMEINLVCWKSGRAFGRSRIPVRYFGMK